MTDVERDTPYTPDEQRVCDYLRKLTNDQVGCGNDPIGFLIANNEWWRSKANRLAAAMREIRDGNQDATNIARRALEDNF